MLVVPFLGYNVFMKKVLFILLLVLGSLTFKYYWSHPLGAKAIINSNIINLELAVTTKEKEKGLGGRDSLPADTGMLFPYDHKEQYMFWMKDMKFPLEIIWIDGNKVADLTKNVPPPTSDQDIVRLAPKVAVDKVLEVNAGTVDRLNIKIGDAVKFTN